MIEREILNRKVFRNQNLFFSEYYLGLLLGERRITRETERLFRRFRNIYEWADSRLRIGSSPSELLKRLLHPLFTEILGFSSARIKPHDNTYSLYGMSPEKELTLLKILRFVEEPDLGPRKSFRFSKTFQFQEALDQESIRWGMLTNGEVLRLLRQGAPSGSWFEIDLRTMFSEGSENDFWLFSRLISLDAFAPDEQERIFLDKVVEDGRKEAEKVQENLGEIFQITLEKFANSILKEHSELLRKFSVEKIHHDLIILFFRLLVIFYAESRGILLVENEYYRKGYSLEDLRDFVEIHQRAFDPRSSYLWNRLKALFKLLQGGIKSAPLFVLEPFGSDLFNPSKAEFLEAITPGDDIVGDLILTFSLTPPKPGIGRLRISYRELDVEQIGSIYEQILDLRPKITQDNLVITKLQGGKEVILPLTQAQSSKLKIDKEIHKNIFFLSTWGGTRKLTGTYYTPKLFTRFLVENALKDIIQGKSSEEILRLKILDPAMGSGAFLVAICRYLSEIYLEKRREEGEIEEAPQIDIEADARRKIAENCLYGVDKNPRAVELAQLSLWLVTASRDLPLAFLKHKLICGDSLVGSKIEDLDSWVSIATALKRAKNTHLAPSNFRIRGFNLDRETLKRVLRIRNKLSSIPDRDIASLTEKEWLYKKLKEDEVIDKVKRIADLKTALWFLSENELSIKHYSEVAQAIWEQEEDLLSKETKNLLEKARIIAEREHFFHWEIYFPELFFNENGEELPPNKKGFDLVIGNPPWDAIKPLTDEFFSAYDPLVFNKKGAKKEKERVKRELLNNPEIQKAWDEYRKKIEAYSFYVRNINEFPLSAVGELNTYRLFLERMLQLTKRKSKLAVFIHGGIYSDDRTKSLRRILLNNHKIGFIFGFENRKRLLKAVHGSFKYVLLGIEKNEEPSSFRAIFMLREPEILFRSDFKPIYLSPKLIKRFSPESLSVPEINKQEDLDLLESIYRNKPLIREMGFRLYNELHMTNDSDIFSPVSGWEEIEKKSYIPLYEGKMIEQFRIDWEEPRYGVKGDEIKERLGNKAAFLIKYRLVIRSVASSTNYRTVIAAILPPENVCGHSIYLFVPLQSETDLFWIV
ncbi:MAG: Eco57I restriction-modification methylase domain-containing protein [Candidatus Hodarchaeota archaeon]